MIPSHWYNIVPDLPTPPPPPLHPATRQPVGPEDLAPLFPMELIGQEVSQERFVAIPQEVLDVYRLWRPTPLLRARRLERALGTPARIYYKYEGGSPSGSHKPNTAVPQAYYNAREGVRGLTTETGAGQWGSALAFACAQFDLDCQVWMVRASYEHKPYRRSLMQVYGATVHASPSPVTMSGSKVLAGDPDSPGSLGIAISEAVEVAAADAGTRYALGSVLNHVLMHQTVIGEEALESARRDARRDHRLHRRRLELRRADLPVPAREARRADRPDVARRGARRLPLVHAGPLRLRLRRHGGAHAAAEDAHAGPRLRARPIHAGGLRYHGMSPLLSHLYELGLFEAVTKSQSECFEAGVRFARTEGIVPAPEPTHALAETIAEALRCKESGEDKVILTALCGHGHFDLAAYDRYLSGRMEDRTLPAGAHRRGPQRTAGLARTVSARWDACRGWPSSSCVPCPCGRAWP